MRVTDIAGIKPARPVDGNPAIVRTSSAARWMIQAGSVRGGRNDSMPRTPGRIASFREHLVLKDGEVGNACLKMLGALTAIGWYESTESFGFSGGLSPR
jgi:hypothetical protein